MFLRMPTDLPGLIFFILNVLSVAVIARALFSWFDPTMHTPVGRFLYQITEPIIGPIRQVVPSLGMFDISPIVALILIQVLSRILASALL